MDFADSKDLTPFQVSSRCFLLVVKDMDSQLLLLAKYLLLAAMLTFHGGSLSLWKNKRKINSSFCKLPWSLSYPSNRKRTNPEIGTRKWVAAVTGLTKLVFRGRVGL